MRVLLLMRGAPGVGKSTFIKEHGLEQYTLSADNIRLLCQSPVLTKTGTTEISNKNDREVWKLLFQILTTRMERGEFVVIDATNSKTKEMTRYKEMADTYRYRIYCVDFTSVPIEECKRRNQTREQFRIVPDEVIENMYSRFKTQAVPKSIKVISPEDLDSIWYKPIDLSSYKRIHHIGDIHGCNTALQEYLRDGLHDDELYIFTGDYIDRGVENVEVLTYLSTLLDKKNVIFLEGNHERWLWYWAHGGTGRSPEFEKVTRPQLEKAGLDPKIVRMFYRRLGQCVYYKYQDKTVLVTHGGLSNVPQNLTMLATEQMIKGVGNYEDYMDVVESFEQATSPSTYQIFGHRNPGGLPIQISPRCFDLEGGVEFGGELRAVVLDEEGFHPCSVKNHVFRNPEEAAVKGYTKEELSVIDFIDQLRHSKYVNEKKFGPISSFNFTKDAFYDKKWNQQTIKARGLFIDTVNGRITARAYEKFFNLNERAETKLDMLQFRLKFPVTAYVKENGFLGLVSYDAEKDDFFISSKSTPEGPYAGFMRDVFLNTVQHPDELKEYIKENDVTFVFECIDPVNDPHIIKYDAPKVVLLDVVKNQIDFEKLPYSQLAQFEKFGFEIKRKAAVLNSWSEFYDWYTEVSSEDYLYEGKEIEGFVVEDSAGFMFKMKLHYYNFWKHMRSVANAMFRFGHYRYTGSLTTPLANEFHDFLKKISSNEDHPTDIIALRDLFYSSRGE